MKENWCALCLAIVHPKAMTVEQTIQLLNYGKIREKISKKDIQDMLKLKQDLTYKEIGQIYGMNSCYLAHLLGRRKRMEV